MRRRQPGMYDLPGLADLRMDRFLRGMGKIEPGAVRQKAMAILFDSCIILVVLI